MQRTMNPCRVSFPSKAWGCVCVGWLQRAETVPEVEEGSGIPRSRHSSSGVWVAAGGTGSALGKSSLLRPAQGLVAGWLRSVGLADVSNEVSGDVELGRSTSNILEGDLLNWSWNSHRSWNSL